MILKSEEINILILFRLNEITEFIKISTDLSKSPEHIEELMGTVRDMTKVVDTFCRLSIIRAEEESLKRKKESNDS